MSKFWTVTVGLLALLAACSSTTPAGPASSPAATASVPTLDGTSWTVTQLNGKPALAGHEPTMEFSGTSVAGKAGCNRYNATFTQDGSTVTMTPGIMTQMACADDMMTQEHAFTVALMAVTGTRAAGDGLELVDNGAKAVLTLARLQDKPLEGTKWTLSGIISADATHSPVPNSTVTLTIADGTLSGKACNTFRGKVTATGGSVKAGPLMSTKMACTSKDLSAQEATVLKTLEAATTYTISGNDLTLKAGDGTGLVFTAA